MKQWDASLVKITRPRVVGIVQRERLFRRLDEGEDTPVLWVSAPAGAGKTTLVASYLESRQLPCIWLRMDEGDSDIATFFYYLGLAVKQALPRKRSPLTPLTPEHLPTIALYVRRYFEALSARLKPPFLIVLDDYQEVADDAPLHRLLPEGLSVLGDGIGVIVISRNEPHPAFTRFISQQRLFALSSQELLFTPEESAEFIACSDKSGLSAQAIAMLPARTQGWVAGLVLHLEMCRSTGADPPEEELQTPEAVFYYFAGELFDRAPSTTQEFLLKTALLPIITLRSAERLTATADAERILARLIRKNFFLTMTRRSPAEYTYHPLFRDFLLDRARQTFSAAEFNRLRQSAAEIMRDAGYPEAAIELAILSKDFDLLATLVTTEAPACFAQGRVVTLNKWLEIFPPDHLADNPWLLYWSAACRLPFDPGAARLHLERAYALFSGQSNTNGKMLALAGIIETCLHDFDRFATLDGWIALMEPMLREEGANGVPEIRARLTGSLYAALALRQPQHPEMPAWEARAEAILASNADPQFRAQVGFHMVVHALWSGHFPRMKWILDQLLALKREQELAPLLRLSIRLAEVMHDWLPAGEPERALHRAEEALAFAAENGVRLWDAILLGHAAAAALSAGQVNRAGELLGRMAPKVVAARSIDRVYYHQLRLWQALLNDDLTLAVAQRRELETLRPLLGLPFGEALCDLDLAHLLHFLGEDQQTAALLAAARRQGEAMGSQLILYMTAVAEAFVALELGQEDAGLRALREAMARGRDQGYVTAHFWRPAVMSKLCVRALEAGIEVPYVRGLIIRHRLFPATAPLGVANWPWAFECTTLGGFTLKVDGKPLTFAGKAQKKPLDLLKAIIASGRREVDEHCLCEALWPDAEGDLARRSLDTTLHRLRKLLGNDKAVRFEEGKLRLDSHLWRVDAWAFEDLFTQFEQRHACRAETDGLPAEFPDAAAEPRFERALELYLGPFLATDPDYCWTISYRERLQSRFMRLVVTAGGEHERAGAWEKAKAAYQRGLEVDALAEELYQRLMLCCRALGQRAEAITVYRRCQTVLAATLGVKPSPQTEAIYHSLVAAS